MEDAAHMDRLNLFHVVFYEEISILICKKLYYRSPCRQSATVTAGVMIV